MVVMAVMEERLLLQKRHLLAVAEVVAEVHEAQTLWVATEALAENMVVVEEAVVVLFQVQQVFQKLVMVVMAVMA
jgi:hypothetical protein